MIIENNSDPQAHGFEARKQKRHRPDLNRELLAEPVFKTGALPD